MVRRAARVDSNHAEIRTAFRSLGWHVVDTSHVGEGWPDLMAVRGGVVRAVEVKTAKGRLTPAQEVFKKTWEGAGGTYWIVRSVDDLED